MEKTLISQGLSYYAGRCRGGAVLPGDCIMHLHYVVISTLNIFQPLPEHQFQVIGIYPCNNFALHLTADNPLLYPFQDKGVRYTVFRSRLIQS